MVPEAGRTAQIPPHVMNCPRLNWRLRRYNIARRNMAIMQPTSSTRMVPAFILDVLYLFSRREASRVLQDFKNVEKSV